MSDQPTNSATSTSNRAIRIAVIGVAALFGLLLLGMVVIFLLPWVLAFR
jgi:hypothetical protein